MRFLLHRSFISLILLQKKIYKTKENRITQKCISSRKIRFWPHPFISPFSFGSALIRAISESTSERISCLIWR